MKKRKSPKAARDANPDNAYRKAERERKKSLKPRIVRQSEAEVKKINESLKEHYKSVKFPEHTVRREGNKLILDARKKK